VYAFEFSVAVVGASSIRIWLPVKRVKYAWFTQDSGFKDLQKIQHTKQKVMQGRNKKKLVWLHSLLTFEMIHL